MPRTIETRLADLEKAALQCEGAHFGHRDLLARLLGKLSETEVRKMIESLIADGQAHAPSLGAHRLAGYCDELTSLREEVEHSRATCGLFGRLARQR